MNKLVRVLIRLKWWQQMLLAAAVPLVTLNLTVAFVGRSAVFPLSPFFLREKCDALGSYVSHLPSCVWNGHPAIDTLISDAEKRHKLPPGLLRAVVEVESEDTPHRISFAGAMGLLQIMPGTARELRLVDPFDSAEAIDAGARYLAGNLRRTKNIRLAVAAYNAGPGAVSGGVVPRNGETEFYVAKVMRAYSREQAAHARPAPTQRRR
ncbi:MAG: lytic transglycosylase domain-containing protein [Myxococcaceae bacterium]